LRRPLVAIRLSACPANLISIGFAQAIPDFGGGRRNTTAPRRATSSPARHFGRNACRYVETSHAVAGPDHKAAQLPAFFLRFVGRITCEARHPCVVKTS
jgi:hypothetical protein